MCGIRVVEHRAFAILHTPVSRSLGPLPLPIVLPCFPVVPVQNMAIIPYHPTLHAVLIKIWAESRHSHSLEYDESPLEMSMSMDLALSDDHGLSPHLSSPTQTDSQRQQFSQTMALPSMISINNPNAYLEDSSCRRSTRQSLNRNGFRHIQLEDHPRKKRCTWTEVESNVLKAEELLANPPKTSADSIPAQLPNDALRAWGIICSVDPEGLTCPSTGSSSNGY